MCNSYIYDDGINHMRREYGCCYPIMQKSLFCRKFTNFTTCWFEVKIIKETKITNVMNPRLFPYAYVYDFYYISVST